MDGEGDAIPEVYTVRLYQVGTGKVLATLKHNSGPISPLAFSRDGRLFAAGCRDGKIAVWSLPTAYENE